MPDTQPPMIPYRLAAETFGSEEMAAARAVLESGRLTMGPNVEAFEREFAAWAGAKHALMVNSGSSANLLAVDAMLRRSDRAGVWNPGDEVLVSALAWPTTIAPIAQLGLVPVLVDVDPKTLALDLESARRVLTDRTRGMFLVHILGRSPSMAPYLEFCKHHGLALIEDACESLGAHDDGTHVGLFGHVGTFSCYFSHHISTIEGGVLLTNDTALRDDLASLRAHGWIRDRTDRDAWKQRLDGLDDRFAFIMGGYNVRPTEIQAACGRVQLTKLDQMLKAREQLAETVAGWVAREVPWLRLVGADCIRPGGVLGRRQRSHSWMTLPFLLRDDAPLSVAEVQARLERAGVETRPIIAGNLARHPIARHLKARVAPSLERCDALLSRGFMVGCHPVPAPGSLATLEAALVGLGKL